MNLKPKNLSLIRQAIKLKFGMNTSIITSINSDAKKVAKLARLNATQVIDNIVNKSDKYSFAMKNLISYLGLNKADMVIEGFDVSHHGGDNGVASLVKFSKLGPEKSKYRLFNIPKELSGNDLKSIKHVLERRINKSHTDPLPDIVLIDGGKLQLETAERSFFGIKKKQLILGIVKGSKRVRSTETILSKNGIVEFPKDSPGFMLLQQIRDESHRFAIISNRKKKNKKIKKSSLDNIYGLGPQKKKSLMNYFKSIQSIKTASVDDLCKVSGISIKLAQQINIFYRS